MKRRRTACESVPIEPPPGYRTAGDEPPDAVRRALAPDRIVSRRAGGGRVGTRSGTRVVLVRGHPVNHLPPALPAVFPCRARGAVRPVGAVNHHVERAALTVDAQGRGVPVGAL
ncbi:hypothetical protein ACF058_03860 [Streptomyces sp. NPDC015501]|uniref:hypothetical protein n=1 Tax=unclassified Streptomyces TaxID=2593676 RepID=UPI0011A71E8D|nr:hypothetical protein A3L22_03820 [Streptomyces griseus subsp. griseus]